MEGERSGIFRSSYRTGRNKDGRGKVEESTRLADTQVC